MAGWRHDGAATGTRGYFFALESSGGGSRRATAVTASVSHPPAPSITLKLRLGAARDRCGAQFGPSIDSTGNSPDSPDSLYIHVILHQQLIIMYLTRPQNIPTITRDVMSPAHRRLRHPRSSGCRVRILSAPAPTPFPKARRATPRSPLSPPGHRRRGLIHSNFATYINPPPLAPRT